MKKLTACMLAGIAAATMGITACASGGSTTTTAASAAASVPTSYTDKNGYPCAPAQASGGYCPEDPAAPPDGQPSDSQPSSQAAQAQAAAARKAAAARAAAAAKAAAARAAKIAAENTPISANQWGRVIRDPSAYVGDIYTISGTVAEYNISSNTFATVENAALVATDANGNNFVVECDASKLGNVQPGQTFTAKVTVVGVAQTQNTVSGGTGEVPDFDASTFTVTG
jgi:hypothetical protein